jgi:hypothetical protein
MSVFEVCKGNQRSWTEVTSLVVAEILMILKSTEIGDLLIERQERWW